MSSEDWAASLVSLTLLEVKLREQACYWTYCLLFVVAPIAAVLALVRLEAPEPLPPLVGALLFMTLYWGLGEHVFRWWRTRIWELGRE